MAKITQEIQNPNEASYLGYSQGTDRAKADTSMGEMLSQVGQLIPNVAKTVYGIQKDVLQEDLQTKIADIQGQAGLDDALATPEGVAPTDIQGEANIFGETNIRAGRGSPAGVARFGSRLENLQDKYSQGKLSESYYNLQLLRMVQQAKSQHSGWNDEIDSIVAKTTGINPANALVRSLRADMDAAERARQAGSTKDEAYVNSHLPYVSPETRAKAAAGERSPEFMTQFKYEASSNLAQVWQAENNWKALERAKQQGTWKEEEAVKVTAVAASNYVTHALRNEQSASGGIQNIVTQIQQKGDKPWTPQEQEALTTNLNNTILKVMTGLDNEILARPEIAALPAEKKKQIRDEALGRLEIIKQAIISKEHGIVSMQGRINDALMDAKMRQIYEASGGALTMGAISKTMGASGPIVISNLLTRPGGAAMVDNISKALLGLDQAESSIGKSSLKDQADRQLQLNKDPVVHKARVDAAVETLITTKNIGEAENVAKAMFGPGNLGFMERYTKSGQQQMFRALTSPAVDLKMAEIGQNNPELYKSYRSWVVEYGFQSQTARALDTINEAATDPASYGRITVDTSSGVPQFVVPPQERKDQFFSGLIPGRLQGVSSLEAAIKDINENIRIIAPIMKREGGDVTTEIMGVLKTRGWDPNAQQRPTFIQGLGNAVVKAFTETSGERNAPGATKTPAALDFPLDKLPKDKAIRPDDKRSDLIDLDPAGLDSIGARSAGLKKVILQAESGGDFDAVFGTSRKIPVSKMTLDEVDTLQTQMKGAGSPSTAIGGFQFIQSTLRGLRQQLGLTGSEVFDEKLQNKLADALLQTRGFGKLMSGEMGHKAFVNSVAKEWAGLPTTEGRSFYEGDGLNRSTVKLRSVLDALKEFRGDPTNPEG